MSEESKRSPQILIVEDNPSIQYLMNLVLSREDHWQPTAAANGANAVRLWNERHFDVILMDMSLPDIPGVEVAKIIRGKEQVSDRKHTPIIAFSGDHSREARIRCREAGIDDYIVKAANLGEVVATIHRHLSSSSKEESSS